MEGHHARDQPARHQTAGREVPRRQAPGRQVARHRPPRSPARRRPLKISLPAGLREVSIPRFRCPTFPCGTCACRNPPARHPRRPVRPRPEGARSAPDRPLRDRCQAVARDRAVHEACPETRFAVAVCPAGGCRRHVRSLVAGHVVADRTARAKPGDGHPASRRRDARRPGIGTGCRSKGRGFLAERP